VSYTVTMIPTDHVMNVWDGVTPHLEKAAEYTYGRYTVDDMLTEITDYEHTLWVAFNERNEIKGAVVTRIKEYPRKRYLDLVFVGGDDGFGWKDEMLRILQHWAYDTGCDGIESSGRLGWSKIFKDDGYKALWQTYELPIADRGLGA